MTAQAKGLGQRQVLYGHVFRNAMLLIIAGFPGAFIHAFFSGSLLIETIFSLDGLGLLASRASINRDYPVVFATLYIFALMGLVVNLVSDFIYTLVDPRIDFESAGGLSRIGPDQRALETPLPQSQPPPRALDHREPGAAPLR